MPQTIMVVSDASWQTQLTAPDDFVFQVHLTDAEYLNTIIEQRAVMVIVGDDIADWERFVTSPKIHNATRRCPVAFISDDADLRALALRKGADLVNDTATIAKDLHRWIRDYGRTLDADTVAEIQTGCQAPLPPRALEAIHQFNQGEYYKQHDLLEEEWVETDGAIRDLYRAILQVGVAYYQVERGNYRGAMKMFQRSVQWLLMLPDTCQGVDIKRLRDESFAIRAELERLGEARFADFDKSTLGKVHFV